MNKLTLKLIDTIKINDEKMKMNDETMKMNDEK